MKIILLLISSLLFGRSIYKERIWYYPNALCGAVWSISILLYIINQNKYFPINESTFWVMTLMLIFFPLGCLLGQKVSFSYNHNKKKSTFANEKQYSIRYTLLLVLCVITIVSLIINDAIIIRQLFSGMSYLQIEMFGESSIISQGATGFFAAILTFVTFPCVYLISPIAAVEFAANRKHKKLLLIFNIVIIVLSALSHGARLQVFVFIMSYLIATRHYNTLIFKQSKGVKWKKILLLIIVVSLSFLFVYLGNSRGSKNFFETSDLYLSCSIPNMNSRIEDFQSSALTYGFTSLMGFFSPIYNVLEKIGIISSAGPIYSRAIDNILSLENYVQVGTGVRINAFVPPALYFYIDFGFFGVILGSIIFGFFAGSSYKRAKRNLNIKAISLFILLMVGVYLMFMKFFFSSSAYALSFVWTLLIFKRERVNEVSL